MFLKEWNPLEHPVVAHKTVTLLLNCDTPALERKELLAHRVSRSYGKTLNVIVETKIQKEYSQVEYYFHIYLHDLVAGDMVIL